ncbi:MAG TPA: SufE family protein [Rhodanobacteraceae bacterium]|nr:SufE family protein [Rhodanobacteraceae bacterium]
MNDLAVNTAIDAQQQIIEEFDFFDDWTGRYQYLIDLGRKLPPLSPEQMTDANKVDGCQSQVWIIVSGDTSRLDLRAASDSAIVSGLIALLLRVYSGRSAREILDTDPAFINAIGLGKHLSPTRSNGLAAMVKTIKAHAERALAQE